MSLAISDAVRPVGQSASKVWLRALELTSRIPRNPECLLADIVQAAARSSPDAPALVSRHENLTYGQLASRANQYSRWALDRQLGKSDTVCLLMHNRPEYLAIWLGLTRVGCTVALLNTNLRGPALAHCVNVVAPRLMIAAADLLDAACEALPAGGVTICPHSEIEPAVERCSDEPPASGEFPEVTIRDRALCIYTSGTTGLPKAANISHARILQWSYWFAGLMGAGPSDRLYNCLPMYHSVGGVLATGALLVAGGSVAIRDGFSASQFWADIAEWDCTLFQYIGELCRYLVNTSAHPLEGAHRIRMACGNGLRPDIWAAFQSRFRIPQILEFYAATEGNVSFFNVEGKPGSIGRIPPYLAHRFPSALVRFDFDTEEPVRDGQGFCVRCDTGETGEAIGRLSDDPANAGNRFEGYTSAEASEKKILRNVFEPGDAWFRTGDLMRRDADGYFYFVDRIGDTFRWKGENVSTSEVAAAIGVFPGIRQAIAYGVAVPNTDGRAGMALIVADDGLDLSALRNHLDRSLPNYAQPVFLRLRRQERATDLTGTFKFSKTSLVREGYAPRETEDSLWFNHRQAGAFVPIDAALYRQIQSGGVRL